MSSVLSIVFLAGFSSNLVPRILPSCLACGPRAHHVIYVAFTIALLTFAFNDFQTRQEQLKKWLVMPGAAVTSSGIFLKQFS